MSEAAAGEVSERKSATTRERREMLALAALSLAVSIATSLLAVGSNGVPQLGAYFDGHFYIEIARSFPLPFSPDGLDYLAQAPGFPALIYLGRLLTPDVLDWGALALGATWLAGVSAVLAFHALCRELGIAALPASLTFLLLNPVWPLLISAPHPEPLAVTFTLLTFTAHLRGALPWSVLWLSLAMLSRFPAVLLGIPLAFDLLVVQRRFGLRTFAWLALPIAVFALFNLYLAWRVPGFVGIWEAHQVHWEASLAIPFSEFVSYWSYATSGRLYHLEVIYGSLALYVTSALVGLRPGERKHLWLALWVVVIVSFHVSLSGKAAVTSFIRLAVLAWPAALLILWRCLPRELPRAAVVVACVATGSLGIWISHHQIGAAIWLQNQYSWLTPKVAGLDSDEPDWTNFELARRIDARKAMLEAQRKRQRARR